jgi:hypothetical protein
MKYEIIRISSPYEDYLEVRKDNVLEITFTIHRDGWHPRSFEEAEQLAHRYIKLNINKPTKLTIYTYEA